MNILCEGLYLRVIGFLFHYKVTPNGRVRTEDIRLVETGRQQRGRLIPRAVKNTRVLLKIGKIIARNLG